MPRVKNDGPRVNEWEQRTALEPSRWDLCKQCGFLARRGKLHPGSKGLIPKHDDPDPTLDEPVGTVLTITEEETESHLCDSCGSPYM